MSESNHPALMPARMPGSTAVKVGYTGGRPLRRGLPKGVSGNPSGVAKVQGITDLRKYMQKFTRPALATILRVMRDKEVPPAVRLAAATYWIDQAWGKPIQALSNPDGSNLNLGEMATNELVKEIERIRAIEGNAIDVSDADAAGAGEHPVVQSEAGTGTESEDGSAVED